MHSNFPYVMKEHSSVANYIYNVILYKAAVS